MVAIIITIFASGIMKSFIQAETAAAKTEVNAGYFGGAHTMQAVEVARASSNTLVDIADSVCIALVGVSIVLFVYNGSLAVYEYLKFKEKKDEES
jgi:hypothetical protein